MRTQTRHKKLKKRKSVPTRLNVTGRKRRLKMSSRRSMMKLKPNTRIKLKLMVTSTKIFSR